MTEEQYWARIEAIPLVFHRDSSDGEARIYRKPDATATPVLVTKPHLLKPEEREAVIQYYESMYSPRFN